jgi:hypothetical protein
MAVLLVASIAHGAPDRDDAPYARDDIVDARRGELPMRHRFLGWTADGEAVIRETVPAASALAGGFQAAITTTGLDGRTRGIGLASMECDDPCVIPYHVARDFIVAERRALAALPVLTLGTPQTGPWHLGTRDHRLGVRIRTGDHSRRRPYGQRLDLIVTGDERPQQLAVIADVWMREDDEPTRIEDAKIVAVYEAPSGDRVAVVVAWTLGFNCYGAPGFTTVVVPVP